MTKVSVIIPIYNVENYLARCLDSVTSQTYSDIEIICINDGSTDSSPMILEAYANFDKRIKVINQENGGLSCARNTGIANATGEYILFVDSDDIISTNTIKSLLKNAEENEADVVIFSYVQGDSDLQPERFLGSRALTNIGVFNIDTISTSLYQEIIICAWNKLYKTSLIKEKIKFNEGQIYEDIPFWVEVFTTAKRITYVFEPFYFYRTNREGQIMQYNDERALDIIKAFDNVERIYKTTGYWGKYKHAIQMCMMLVFLSKYYNARSDIKEKLFNSYKIFCKDINYEFYENQKLYPHEKIALERFKKLNNSSFEEFENYLKENSNEQA